MRKILVLSLFMMLSSVNFPLQAQNPQADSLEHLLRQHGKRDTIRVLLLNSTARAFFQNDNERMYELAKEALALSKKLRFEAGRAEAIQLMGKYHYSKSENEKAADYIREALFIYEGLNDRAGISTCMNSLGRIQWKLGNYGMAEKHYTAALELARELGDDGLIAASTSSFGSLSLQRGDYPEAKEYLQESINHAELAGDKHVLASNLHNLGYLHMRQSNYEEAINFFEQTRVLMQDVGDEQGISGVLLNMGIIYQNQGRFLDAIASYQRSSEIDEAFGDNQGVSRCLNNIGLIYQIQGNYPLALDYIQRSLIIKQEIRDRRGIASCLMNIGSIHSDQNDLGKALDYYFRSLEIMEELEDKRGISNCLANIGSTLGNLGSYNRALEHLQRALDLKVELGERYAESDCLLNLGRVHEQMGTYPAAMNYYGQSLHIKKEISDRNGMCKLFSMIGSTYLKTGDISRAMEYTQMSLALARELELSNQEVDIYKQLSKIYVSTGNYRKAYENQLLHQELYDSLYNTENIRMIASLEYEYAYERDKQAMELEQQKRDALQEEEDRRQAILRNSYLVGFILMILLVAVILRNFIQKRAANRVLEERNRRIENQNEAITDSISYALRIQQALFPPKEMVNSLLNDYFIFNRPRDIVSGDFYWLAQKNGRIFLALADCTGHGVPGAFMSLLGMAFLNEIASASKDLCASNILDELRERVIQALHQTGRYDEARDGMEMGLCVLEPGKNELQYAGAFRPLYQVRDGQLTETRGDHMPIGIYGEDPSFTCHQIKLRAGDMIYLFSDGYVDQLGGPHRKTYRARRFRELLMKVAHKQMEEQHLAIEESLDEWKGSLEQIDDILVIGFRV